MNLSFKYNNNRNVRFSWLMIPVSEAKGSACSFAAQPRFLAGEDVICWKGESSSQRHQLKSNQKITTGHSSTLWLGGQCHTLTRIGIFLEEPQGTEEQSSPFLQLSWNLLHVVLSKPLVTVVCSHGLHRDKWERGQNRSKALCRDKSFFSYL